MLTKSRRRQQDVTQQVKSKLISGFYSQSEHSTMSRCWLCWTISLLQIYRLTQLGTCLHACTNAAHFDIQVSHQNTLYTDTAHTDIQVSHQNTLYTDTAHFDIQVSHQNTLYTDTAHFDIQVSHQNTLYTDTAHFDIQVSHQNTLYTDTDAQTWPPPCPSPLLPLAPLPPPPQPSHIHPHANIWMRACRRTEWEKEREKREYRELERENL